MSDSALSVLSGKKALVERSVSSLAEKLAEVSEIYHGQSENINLYIKKSG
ncbi:MAG: hypothetical protein ACI4GV_07310 [Acutalibacteraceae bacterium]